VSNIVQGEAGPKITNKTICASHLTSIDHKRNKERTGVLPTSLAENRRKQGSTKRLLPRIDTPTNPTTREAVLRRTARLEAGEEGQATQVPS